MLGAGVLELFQELLQLRHLLLGVVHAAVAGGVLQALRHAVEVAAVHLRLVGVEGHLAAFAAGLLGQGLHVLLDGVAQLLEAAFQLGALVGVLRVRLCGIHGVAHRLPGFGEGAGGAVRGAFLQGEGELPHAGLGLVHGGLARGVGQEGAEGAEVHDDAEGVVEQVRAVGEGVEGGLGVGAGVGGQAELLADGDHSLSGGVVEGAFGQGERGVGAGAELAGGVVGDDAGGDGEAGPGVGGEVLGGRAVGVLGGAAERGGEEERWGVGAVAEAELELDGGDAVIVVGHPGEAGLCRRAAAGQGGAGRLGEGGGGGAVGDGGDRPGGEVLPGAADDEAAVAREVALGLPASGVEGGEGGVFRAIRDGGGAVAAGDAGGQVGADGDRGCGLAGVEEDGGEAGVGGGRDPGLDDRGGGGGAGGEAGQDGGPQAARGVGAGDGGGGGEAHDHEAAQGPAVVAGEAGPGQADAEALDLRQNAGLVGAPKGLGLGGGGGGAVFQGGEGAVAEAGRLFQAAVGGAGTGGRDPAEAAPQENGDGGQHEHGQQDAGPGGQESGAVAEGEDGIGAARAEGGPQGGPQAFPPQGGAGRRPLAREAGRKRGERRHQPSQSGTCSWAHKASSGWRGRMTDQRPASTSTSAARGRAL